MNCQVIIRTDEQTTNDIARSVLNVVLDFSKQTLTIDFIFANDQTTMDAVVKIVNDGWLPHLILNDVATMSLDHRADAPKVSHTLSFMDDVPVHRLVWYGVSNPVMTPIRKPFECETYEIPKGMVVTPQQAMRLLTGIDQYE